MFLHKCYSVGEPTTVFQKNPGCFQSKYVQHELMHIIGFHHEYKRPDWDEYIKIDYEHINPDKKNEAKKLVWGVTALNLGTPYDYDSIMQYGPYVMNSPGNSCQIITSLQSGATIGEAQRLSSVDITELHGLYNY